MTFQKITLLSLLITVGCADKKEKLSDKTTQLNKSALEIKKLGRPYFDFDEIEQYRNSIDENSIGDLYDNRKKSSLDKLKMDVLLNETPTSLNDTAFVSKLQEIGYSKTNVAESKFQKINEIFSEKKYTEFYETSCIYVYRDILIFKKKSKIVGIAKICFGCDDSKIVGTNLNTEQFGMDGDYQMLKMVLDKK